MNLFLNLLLLLVCTVYYYDLISLGIIYVLNLKFIYKLHSNVMNILYNLNQTLILITGIEWPLSF